jgi:hypothetical protein
MDATGSAIAVVDYLLTGSAMVSWPGAQFKGKECWLLLLDLKDCSSRDGSALPTPLVSHLSSSWSYPLRAGRPLPSSSPAEAGVESGRGSLPRV